MNKLRQLWTCLLLLFCLLIIYVQQKVQMVLNLYGELLVGENTEIPNTNGGYNDVTKTLKRIQIVNHKIGKLSIRLPGNTCDNTTKLIVLN